MILLNSCLCTSQIQWQYQRTSGPGTSGIETSFRFCRMFSTLVLALGVVCCGFVRLGVEAKKTQTVTLPGMECHSLTEDIDAVNLISGFTTSEGCYRMEAEREKFVILFPDMDLRCGQTIELYYRSRATGTPDKTIDCYTSPKTAYTPGKYLTVQFKHVKQDTTGSTDFHFSIVVTSYEDDFFCGTSDTDCHEFGQEDICMDSDQKCDGIENCPSGSDESSSCDLFVADFESTQQLAIGIVIAIVVVSLLGCVGCIVGIIFCVRRSRARPGRTLQPPPSGPTQTVIVQAPAPGAPAQPPAPYYPVGAQAPPPAGYVAPPAGYAAPPPGYQQAMAPPPGSYPPQPGAQPGGYQPVPTGPPVGEPGYPQQQSMYPVQASAPPPDGGAAGVQYNPASYGVKVPL